MDERVLAEKGDQWLAHPTVQRDGVDRLCRWQFTPLANPDGSIRAVISLVSDITEEQRVARDLDGLRKRLARAEETERSRIARELHDGLSQRLAALSIDMRMAVDALDASVEADPRRMLASIQSDLHAVSTDVHALSRQLHPTVLDDLGLSRALRSECSRRSRGSGATIDFTDETEDLEIAPDVALALFRIARESLQNAAKKASATEISVRMRESHGRIELLIRDNGLGFDPEAAADKVTGGLGLASMRERARLVNADIDIRAANTKGTVVSVLVANARTCATWAEAGGSHSPALFTTTRRQHAGPAAVRGLSPAGGILRAEPSSTGPKAPPAVTRHAGPHQRTSRAHWRRFLVKSPGLRGRGTVAIDSVPCCNGLHLPGRGCLLRGMLG